MKKKSSELKLSLVDWLHERVDGLTPSELRLAAHLTENPETWAFESATSLAEMLSLHRSTIVRFAQNMGLKGFPELQNTVREAFILSFSPPTDSVDITYGDQRKQIIQQIYQRELRNLRQTYQHVDMEAMEKTARSLAGAEKVVIFGRRFSYPIALHISMSLQMMRERVAMSPGPGGVSIDTLFDLTSKDSALVVSLKRHSPEVRRTLAFLDQKEVPFALLTDTSPVVGIPKRAEILQVNIGSASILESYTSMSSIGHALLTLASRFISGGSKRLEKVERAWHLFNSTICTSL